MKKNRETFNSFCLVLVCLIIYFQLFVLVYYFIKYDENNVYIDFQNEPVQTVSKRFISYGIDTMEIYAGVNKLHLDSPKLLRMTAALGPSHLRIGGTMSERLLFVDELENSNLTETEQHYFSKSLKNSDKFLPYFVMDGETWLQIYKFSKQTGSRILFSVNVLLRTDDKWDPTNFIRLLKFSHRYNMTDIDWQMGNEPNSFQHVFNESVSPQQLSRDFLELKRLVTVYFPASQIVGPDTTRPQPHRPSCVKYMKEFLASSPNTVDIISWHQYYLNGRIATLDDFWNPETLNLLQSQVDTMHDNIVAYRKGRPMWLSETSSAYGGGAPGLSNSYAAGPLWLDKLGLAARSNIQVVARQSLLGANYSLINHNSDPNPDWWTSLLYRQTVGAKVLLCKNKLTKFQRLYCHCTADTYLKKDTNAVTIFGINLNSYVSDVALNGPIFDSENFNIDEFILTSDNRMSHDIYLNNKLLKYLSDIPKLVPKKLGNTKVIRMLPYSLGFWVIHNVSIPLCGTS